MGKVTAKQIAARAGVSQAAVSLALRGRPGVGEEVRSRILALAQEMGYERQKPGGDRGLLLQLVIYKRHGKVVADTPFFEQLTQGAAEEAQARGCQLLVTYFYGSQPAQEQLRSIKSMRCAGIILLATEMTAADIHRFDGIGVPLIVLDNYFFSARYDSVVIDNSYGVWNAVRYLIQCGHTRLGYLHSNVDIHNFRGRYDGYLSGCRCLPEGAAQDSAKRVILVSPSSEGACADMHAYLATEPMLPSAFFADNDRIAAGCCRALREAGYRIPQDISVLGFDDSSICTLMDPPLTTMRVEKRRMGALAVGRLHDHIRRQMTEVVRCCIAPEIIVRDSVLDRTK